MVVGKSDRDEWKIGLKLENCPISRGLRGNFFNLSLKHTGTLHATFVSRNTPSSLKIEQKLYKTMFCNKFPSIPSTLHVFLSKILGKVLKFNYIPYLKTIKVGLAKFCFDIIPLANVTEEKPSPAPLSWRQKG